MQALNVGPTAATAPAGTALPALVQALVAELVCGDPHLSLRAILTALADQVGELVWEAHTRRAVSDLVTRIAATAAAEPDEGTTNATRARTLADEGMASGVVTLHAGLHPTCFSFDAGFDATADGEMLALEMEQYEPELYESPAGVHSTALASQQTLRRNQIAAGLLPEESAPRQRHAIQQSQALPLNSSHNHPASPSPPPASAEPIDPDGEVPSASTSGFNKPLTISDSLAAFLRLPPGSKISRTQCIRFVCDYIKQQELQDPRDRRVIICDEPLRQLFAGEERVSYFTLNKHLSAHFERLRRVYKRRTRPSAAAAAAAAAARDGTTVSAGAGEDEDPDAPGLEHMRGFNTPMRLSPQLAEFFFTQTSFHPDGPILYLSRPSVVRLIWTYVKQQRLQDDRDGRIIHLQTDPYLQQLLGVDGMAVPESATPGAPPLPLFSITMRHMNSAISKHLTKIDRGTAGRKHAQSAVAAPTTLDAAYVSAAALAASSGLPALTTPSADEWSRIEALAQQFEKRVKSVGDSSRPAPAPAPRPTASPLQDSTAAAAASSSAAGEPASKKPRLDAAVVAELEAADDDEEEGEDDEDELEDEA